MMSRKEYMYWQNRKDRVSEYICVRASGASEQLCGVFNSFTVKKVSLFTINVKFKVILSSKSGGGGGGMFVQAIPPPPKKVGGYIPPIPPRIYDLYYVCYLEKQNNKTRACGRHSASGGARGAGYSPQILVGMCRGK